MKGNFPNDFSSRSEKVVRDLNCWIDLGIFEDHLDWHAFYKRSFHLDDIENKS